MFFLAVRYMLWRKNQSLLVIIGLALGAATFIGLSGILIGMREYILGQLVDNDAHVRVSGRDESITETSINGIFYSDPVAQVITWKKPPLGRRGTVRIYNPETWMRTLNDDPDVTGFSPQTLVQVSFRSGSTSAFGKIIGNIPERQLAVTTIGKYVTQGTFKSIALGGNRIILGDGLSSKLGVSINDTVWVSNGGDSPTAFKVSGLYHLGIRTFDDTIAYCFLGDAQRLNNAPGILTDISIHLLDPARAAEKAIQWQSLFTRESVLSWDQSNAGFLSVFKIQDATRYFLSIAFIIVESFGIYNILSILVTQKRRDIAILKSLGFGKSRIVNIFLIQGLLFGILGGALGLIMGYWMCRGLQLVPIGANPTYSAPQSHLIIAYPIPVYFASLVLTILGAVASAAIPARKAGKFAPIEIIRSGE